MDHSEEIVARNLIKKGPVDPYAQESKSDKQSQPAVFHLILVSRSRLTDITGVNGKTSELI